MANNIRMEGNGNRLALNVSSLSIATSIEPQAPEVISEVDLVLSPGKITGLAGESGSGKTVTSLACLGLTRQSNLFVKSGSIQVGSHDILKAKGEDLRRIRGSEIAMIFQEPMVSLDPNFTVGSQLVETITSHQKVSSRNAKNQAIELLTRVGIPTPETKFHSYPFEMSGGQLQRVLIAMAVSNKPRVLIADEPTTALDVTVQSQIMDLLKEFADEGMAILLVTHDLGVLAEYADDLYVMYAGQVVEHGPIFDVLSKPQHPYTHGLISSVPDVAYRKEQLFSIPGRVPQPKDFPHGCRFQSRCSFAEERCGTPIPLSSVNLTREVRCIRSEELHLRGILSEASAPERSRISE